MLPFSKVLNVLSGSQVIGNNESGSQAVGNIENNEKDYSKYSLGDFEKLTLRELQDIARQNRLKIKGKKTELVDRVKAHYNFNQNLV